MKILERILGDGYVELEGLDLDKYTAAIINKEQPSSKMLDMWVLYQFDSLANSCRLRYVLENKDDAVKIYRDYNLHSETDELGGRNAGDVGIIVHNQEAYFESNIPQDAPWGDKASK